MQGEAGRGGRLNTCGVFEVTTGTQVGDNAQIYVRPPPGRETKHEIVRF